MDNKDKILERIRKMLTLARDAGATEGERDNALRMAHATLAKYNLDIAELEAKGEKTNDRGVLRATFYGRPWARQVVHAVADMCFCDYIFCSVGGRSKEAAHFFVGRQSNSITAAELSEYVVASIHKEASSYKRRYQGTHDTYRSFAFGAAGSIVKRCRELKAQNEGEVTPTGKGLVVYREDEAKANKGLMDKAFPKQGKGRSGKEFSGWEAARDGREFGETVSLHRQVEGSKSNAFRLGRDGD